jgi:hypothetical protein
MKAKNTALLMSLIAMASLSASAGSTIFSGAALGGLTYVGDPGDAQFVAGTPDVAQLYTPDLSVNGDSPAVFDLSPTGTLDELFGNYRTTTGTTVQPYWAIWVSPAGNTSGYAGDLEIYTLGGSRLNSSSTIHAFGPGWSDLGGTPDGYWGDTLLQLDAVTYNGQPIGDMTLDAIGLEIGDGGSGAGTANINGMMVGSCPDAASTMSLLGIGFGAFVGLRRRLA